MITKLVMAFFVTLINLVLSILPSGGPPSWWSDAAGYIGTVWGYGTGLGAWLPWGLAAVCVPAVFVAMGVGFTIKIIRIIASFFTAGGGSAA